MHNGCKKMQGVDSITLSNRMHWGATLENGWEIPVPRCNWQLLINFSVIDHIWN